MDGWINVLFSITNTPLSQSEREQLSRVQASWVLLNNRLGRFFVDIIGPKTQLIAIRDKLIELGRDPRILGVFEPTKQDILDGGGKVIGWHYVMLLTQANGPEYLAVARDVITYDALGNVTSTTRPTSYIDIHRWAGWPEKVIP
jgi:hypothetical protein